jgi:hypothetical protein
MNKFNSFIKNEEHIEPMLVQTMIKGMTYEGWILPKKGNTNFFLYADKEMTETVKTPNGKTVMISSKELYVMGIW